MLVLSRRIDEAVQMGEGYVRVLGIKDGRVSLGFDAPPTVRIMRTELVERDLGAAAELPSPAEPAGQVISCQ